PAVVAAPIAAIASVVPVAGDALAPPVAPLVATASRGVVGAMIGVAITTPAGTAAVADVSSSWWSSGLVAGSCGDVVLAVDDEDVGLPPSAAAIAAWSAASFGSTGVAASAGSVGVVGSAAASV